MSGSETASKKVLECSSKGDKRLSALFAKVEVFGKFDTIEGHYQTAKLYRGKEGLVQPKDWKEAKSWQKNGEMPVRMKVNDIQFPITYLSDYFKLLWVKYLDSNPELVTFASQFDDFTDMFKGKHTLNCQADVIRQYVKGGRNSIMRETQPFIRLLGKKSYVMETIGNVLACEEKIMGHQVNAQGVMGAGLAKSIKEKYPNVFEEYKLECQIFQRQRTLLGKCQLVDTPDCKIVANLFGQHSYGTTKVQTEYEHLRTALTQLRDFAERQGHSVALPFQLGCGHAGGDWSTVRKMIEEVFNNGVYVTIYRLTQ